MNDKTLIRVAVTGAAGQIGYSLLFRIASGGLFGPDQPVALNLIEIEPGMKALEGVCMELDDCAFPLLKDIRPTSDLNEGLMGLTGLCLWAVFPEKREWSVATCSESMEKSLPVRGRLLPRMQPRMCGCWWWGTPAIPIV